MWKKMNFGTKTAFFLIIAFTVGFTAIYFLIQQQLWTQSIQRHVSKSRTILIKAEQSRSYISDLREQRRAFDDNRMIQDVLNRMNPDEHRIEVILSNVRKLSYYWTIPVVASWNIIKTDAEKEGYRSKVIKINARNPENEAPADEIPYLEKIKTENLSEYWLIDEKDNVLRYYRPVILEESCLLCHGNETHYPEGNGYDPIGMKMENWKAGDIHGAFEIITPLAPVRKNIQTTLFRYLFISILMLITVSALVFLIIGRFAIKPVREISKNLRKIEKGYTQIHINSESEDEIGQMILALNNMSTRLSDTALKIRKTASLLVNEGYNLNSESEKISQMATEQAGIMSSLSETIKQNKDYSVKTDEIVKQLVTEVNQGHDSFVKTIETMKLIAKQTSVIDEIGLQTDILSINANIEATHAGEAGKNFAIVGRQVTELAAESKEAAEKINELSSTSMKIADQSEKILSDIVKEINKTSEYVEQISYESNEQTKAIDQVNESIHQNSIAAENIAQLSEKLLEHSKDLKNIIAFFQEQKKS